MNKMKIDYREAKSILTKSAIPGIDYVCNPYVGCQHGCIYCYAEFMKRFTNHGGEIWGEFLDIKQYDWKKIKPHKYDESSILLSSVTDPYTPAEKKYQSTRNILNYLKETKGNVEILTKSQLVRRDIDLFKQFQNIKVGVSLNTLDSNIARKLEPKASPPIKRLEALKEIANQGIKTWVFISPIFPKITDWKKIINQAKSITTDFAFENLNFRGHNIQRIMNFIKTEFPHYEKFYIDLRKSKGIPYWDILADQIEKFGQNAEIQMNIAFHHGGFTKKKNVS